MSQASKMILVAIAAALIGSGGTYLWQSNQPPILSPVNTQEKILNESETTTEFTTVNGFAEIAKYNCETSSGSFNDNNCLCPSEEEFRSINKYNCENTKSCLSEKEVQELIYDKNTGYCQTVFGGPSGEAFFASIGLPYGEYGFFMNIIVNNCEKSGGEMSGAACICSKNMTYDKATGYCK